ACLLTLPSVALATNYYVQANGGSNANTGLSSSAPFADLEYAMKKLQPGDTLLVRSGVYREFPYLSSAKYRSGTASKPILVRPYGNERPVISKSSESRLVDVR
ncbi:hypothetical protein, partial [Pseudohalioglobus lutimaris]|uniref:hypothetical protein n=1 Tax=Pseudohalioglobus lutimaris TaxID=1737061 RepID=UPI001A9F40CF